MDVMRRLYEANQIRHFLVWLGAYLGLSVVAINIGSAFGVSDHVAVAIPLAALALVLFVHLRRTRIAADIGLGVPSAVAASRMWFYLPLLVLVCLPLLGGVDKDMTALAVTAIVVHYAAVGFLEETLMRGLLLRALLEKWPPVWAVVVSALTFGVGHVVSLLIGQSASDTVLQIINATVVGLIFTLVVIATGSLTAVIVIHALYNILAGISGATEGTWIIFGGIAVLLLYGTWLLIGAGAATRLKELGEQDGRKSSSVTGRSDTPRIHRGDRSTHQPSRRSNRSRRR